MDKEGVREIKGREEGKKRVCVYMRVALNAFCSNCLMHMLQPTSHYSSLLNMDKTYIFKWFLVDILYFHICIHSKLFNGLYTSSKPS